MGNQQSKTKVRGNTKLFPYVRVSSSPPPSQSQPLLASDEHLKTSNSNLTCRMCSEDSKKEIETMRKSFTDLAKKVDELEKKQCKDNTADIKRIDKIIAEQDKQIKRLKEKLVEQHEQRNTALVEINATSENTINQSIPDLMSFEPVTWDLLPSSVDSLQETKDYLDDFAGGMVIIIFLLSILIGLNL
ncbi:uncharacterized protein LOC120255929 [Dioscorea cayenensis subsp. rotundata]|uniref:Uncharacterized protein LOC120255929 n=1 Tax=Dioscorea cayennensis subsp. rotundata TaxID=55577 RepID=A0AB40AXB7_DIOCR|nr:uncharacterized protein LOC120255929 [Dioscorea cayenensis subsp. rotundata]